MRILSSVAFLVVNGCALGQTAPVAFEVASVKPAPPSDPNHISVHMRTDAGRLMYSNPSLRDLIRTAYRVKDSQIFGPDWLSSARFDVAAKLPEGASEKQIPLMLQALLAERFQLTLHRETKPMSVYALVPAKGGPKLQESDAGKGGMNTNTNSKGHHMSGNVPLEQLADSLSHMVDRPVIDMTGIKGSFVIEMSWAPEETQLGGKASPKGDGKAADDGPDGATIFTVLQEKLGLKLEARKLPFEILTIDHAEKVPTEN